MSSESRETRNPLFPAKSHRRLESASASVDELGGKENIHVHPDWIVSVDWMDGPSRQARDSIPESDLGRSSWISIDSMRTREGKLVNSEVERELEYRVTTWNGVGRAKFWGDVNENECNQPETRADANATN